MNLIDEIKSYAITNKVPIIMDEGLQFILRKIDEYRITNILEIGTAIGYSAISFAVNGCHVTTIERDMVMYETAVKNVNKANLNHQIRLINDDALMVELGNEKYDLIFIDAAKAQYEKFFLKFSKNLNDNGIIICDNLDFHHLDVTKVSRSTRRLIEKLNQFKDFLRNNADFTTSFYEIGDGMSVSVKK